MTPNISKEFFSGTYLEYGADFHFIFCVFLRKAFKGMFMEDILSVSSFVHISHTIFVKWNLQPYHVCGCFVIRFQKKLQLVRHQGFRQV